MPEAGLFSCRPLQKPASAKAGLGERDNMLIGMNFDFADTFRVRVQGWAPSPGSSPAGCCMAAVETTGRLPGRGFKAM